jgi:3alpha(or 20beta)-hydroxysteroid dehydrogenase
MSTRLEGRVSIVTGAARGTGAVIAELLASEGATVWAVDVLDDLNESTTAALREKGLDVRPRSLDVTDESGWSHLVDEIVGEHSRLDVLVNNAAILHLGSLAETPAATFEQILHVNLMGPFLGIRSVAPQMMEQRAGSIVNIASVDGLMSNNGVSAYSSSKFALRGLTKTAAIELGEHNVRVNAVCPTAGSFDMFAPFVGSALDITAAMNAPKRAMLADLETREHELIHVAEMVLFLASDAARGCTGGDYPVDRGETAGFVIPGLPGNPRS